MLTPGDPVLSLLGLRPTGDLGGLTCYTSKRGKIVWFIKAPPTCPPSDWQSSQRNKFRFVAQAWNALPAATREQWHQAEVLSPLSITGYNLFVYWSLTGDDAAIATIERQTGTTLL